ncbi:MAG: TolC family protein [Armatimonadota bacterium]
MLDCLLVAASLLRRSRYPLLALMAWSCGAFALADPLTLPDATQYALAHNPRLAAAQFRWQAAASQVSRTRGLSGPQLRLTADALHYSWLPSGKANILGPGHEDYLVILDATKILYSPTLRAQVDIVSADYLTACERLRRSRQQVVYDVAASWYEVQRNQKRLDADQASLKALETHEQMVKDYFRLGKVPELDVLQVGVRVADARQRVISSENAVRLATLQLSNAMGVGASEAIEVPPPADSIVPVIGPLAQSQEQVEEAWLRRPEALAAEAQIVRSEAERRQAAAGLQPDARAVANYYREGTSWPDHDEWFVGIKATLQLFDSDVTKHAKAAATANTAAATADLETVRQLVQLEVTQAQLRLREGAERVAATRAAVDEAERALEIERRAYEVGMSDILDVLDTETSMTRAAYNYIDAVFTYHTAEAQLLLAVGADPAVAPPASKESQ